MLVIDEVYSLTHDLFDGVVKVGQELRKLNQRFFLLGVGDFMQLPPVGNAVRPEQESGPGATGSPAEHIFAGTEWRKLPTLLLTEIVRQTSGDILAKFAALGWELEPTDAQLDELVSIVQDLARAHQQVDEGARYCACTNQEVNAHNAQMEGKLRKDHTEERTYSAVDSGDSAYLSDCPLLPEVTFMVGMIVMLVVNLDTHAHLVNGMIGVVAAVGAESITAVFFGGRVTRVFEPYKLEVIDWVSNQVLASRVQFPFVPAFGLTVHKQQGSTVREPIRMDMKGMGVHEPRRRKEGWTDADRRAFLYVACTRPVRRDLLVLNLTAKQKAPTNLKQVFRSGLDLMMEFVSVLKENNILSQHT